MHLKDLFNYGKININYIHSKARWPPELDFVIPVFSQFLPEIKKIFSGMFFLSNHNVFFI